LDESAASVVLRSAESTGVAAVVPYTGELAFTDAGAAPGAGGATSFTVGVVSFAVGVVSSGVSVSVIGVAASAGSDVDVGAALAR
jgi:hypothetical protein